MIAAGMKVLTTLTPPPALKRICGVAQQISKVVPSQKLPCRRNLGYRRLRHPDGRRGLSNATTTEALWTRSVTAPWTPVGLLQFLADYPDASWKDFQPKKEEVSPVAKHSCRRGGATCTATPFPTVGWFQYPS